MNKFYLEVRDELPSHHIIVTVFQYKRSSVRESHDWFYIDRDDSNILYSVCEKPAKALMYLSHEDVEIRDLAKLILQCNEPVEVKQ